MDYVLEKVPPPRPGFPRPRFSLYLSSQLQYGVVVVFHRQCAILLGKMLLADLRDEMLPRVLLLYLSPRGFLEELQSIVGQLVKQRTSQKIDMDEKSRREQLHNISSILHNNTRSHLDLFCFTFQTSSGPPRRPDAPGKGRESSGPIVWSHVHAGCHTQPQFTNQGTKRTRKERKKLTQGKHF